MENGESGNNDQLRKFDNKALFLFFLRGGGVVRRAFVRVVLLLAFARWPGFGFVIVRCVGWLGEYCLVLVVVLVRCDRVVL